MRFAALLSGIASQRQSRLLGPVRTGSTFSHIGNPVGFHISTTIHLLKRKHFLYTQLPRRTSYLCASLQISSPGSIQLAHLQASRDLDVFVAHFTPALDRAGGHGLYLTYKHPCPGVASAGQGTLVFHVQSHAYINIEKDPVTRAEIESLLAGEQTAELEKRLGTRK